jgi:hypothetical protein
VAGAYRFVREDLASRAADDMGGGYVVIEIEIPP